MKPQRSDQLLELVLVDAHSLVDPSVSSRLVRDTRERITAMVRKIPDNRLLLEIDVLPRTADALPSEVFRGILGDIADIKNVSAEEIEASNQKNVRELVGDSPRVAEITALLKPS